MERDFIVESSEKPRCSLCCGLNLRHAMLLAGGVLVSRARKKIYVVESDSLGSLGYAL